MSKLRSLRACGAILRVAGVLVPGGRRAEWLREWRAELWHEAMRLRDEGRGSVPAGCRLLCRIAGAFPDAFAMRRFHPAPAQEDLASAIRVVLRSPAAAGGAMLLIALGAAVDIAAVSVTTLAVYVPSEFRGLVLGFTVSVIVLLAVASCIAAAVAVGWSDAARREEALRRALGVAEPRLRRQRALEGVLIGLLGTAMGAYIASALLDRVRVVMLNRGLEVAMARLDAGPGPTAVAFGLAVTMASLLALVSSLKRKRVALE